MITEEAVYRLTTWFSPAYPIGAFSYSHGLEYAVEAGRVRDRESLVAWIGLVIAEGSGRVDARFFLASWDAASAGDAARLAWLGAEASAWRGTAETALESRNQGAAFLETTRRAWPHPGLACLPEEAPLAVAAGAVAGAHGIPRGIALASFLQSLAANLVSAGVRLIPLGQTDGQIACAALEGPVLRAAAAATDDLGDLGTASPLVDLCSMRHETQYTRLFRS